VQKRTWNKKYTKKKSSSQLIDEGYAETPEAAEAIMVNMSEEWRQSILG